jgi:hypothetical protein
MPNLEIAAKFNSTVSKIYIADEKRILDVILLPR